MPIGLANFVRAQGSDANIESKNGKDLLARRRAEALSARIKPKVSDTRSTSMHDHHGNISSAAPVHVQRSESYGQNGGDWLAESVLSDSDDTTRDLGSSGARAYQNVSPLAGRQEFGDGNGIEQGFELGYTGRYAEDEEEHGYLDNANSWEDDLSVADGQSRAFDLEISNDPISTMSTQEIVERAARLRESQQFSEAAKLHKTKISSSHLNTAHPGISGRFTTTNNIEGGFRRYYTGLGSTNGLRYESQQQGSDLSISDDLLSHESAGYTDKKDFQQEGQRHIDQLKHGTSNSAATESRHNNEHQSQEQFVIPDTRSDFSAASSQSSSLQRTPQAKKNPSQQTPTSNGIEKRKNEESELDYDINKLSAMKYSELKDQPFDTVPNATHSTTPETLSSPDASLEDQLEHFKDLEPNYQINFFAQMPLDKWEHSGDWFLGRFGDIMSKLKDARRAKRDVSKAFEEKLASREDDVRTKAESIQEVFRQMRAGGEGVLKGKAP